MIRRRVELRGKLITPILVAQVQAGEACFKTFGEMRLERDDAGLKVPIKKHNVTY